MALQLHLSPPNAVFLAPILPPLLFSRLTLDVPRGAFWFLLRWLSCCWAATWWPRCWKGRASTRTRTLRPPRLCTWRPGTDTKTSSSKTTARCWKCVVHLGPLLFPTATALYASSCCYNWTYIYVFTATATLIARAVSANHELYIRSRGVTVMLTIVFVILAVAILVFLATSVATTVTVEAKAAYATTGTVDATIKQHSYNLFSDNSYIYCYYTIALTMGVSANTPTVPATTVHVVLLLISPRLLPLSLHRLPYACQTLIFRCSTFSLR